MNIEELYKSTSEIDELGRYIPLYYLSEGAHFRIHKHSRKSYVHRAMDGHYFIQDMVTEAYFDSGQLIKPIRMVFYED